MQYFTDGLDGLIRVHTDAARASREFFRADAEQLAVDGVWYPRRNLILDILRSGDYRAATETEAMAIVADTHRRVADDELAAFLLDLGAGTNDYDEPSPWKYFVRYDDDSDPRDQSGTTGNAIEHVSELVVSVTR